jgi:hypothetical protein
MSTTEHDWQQLGLTVLPDFISVADEQTLTNSLAKSLHTGHRDTAQRNTIQRFGASIPYASHILSAVIPPAFARLCEKLHAQQLVPLLPDSVTINEYRRGQRIDPHIDDPAGGSVITVLSLGTPATMVFSHEVQPSFSIVLPSRSLVQLRGTIRYNWTHGILPVSGTRYSIVFRCSKETHP